MEHTPLYVPDMSLADGHDSCMAVTNIYTLRRGRSNFDFATVQLDLVQLRLCNSIFWAPKRDLQICDFETVTSFPLSLHNITKQTYM
ncbi:hypothetical protein E2C01_085325 [Portunus trituberculatus]|uniref:Uncharacterized protein n=1 Tax=Portunus trituberculatus TaxID=210409 RepID=A0A5B7J6J4_PORTR|nr:hypothetical protein [Portunus trituberculatus]